MPETRLPEKADSRPDTCGGALVRFGVAAGVASRVSLMIQATRRRVGRERAVLGEDTPAPTAQVCLTESDKLVSG